MFSRFAVRRRPLPPALTAALNSNDRVLSAAELTDETLLVATRFGLWHIDDRGPVCWPWDLVSKATLAGQTLRVVIADITDTWPDGTVVLSDRAAQEFTLTGKNVLTDAVHTRVRGSVVKSTHLESPAGAWVVLRRVAGRDGLTVQVRPDPGSDPTGPEFVAAVARTAVALRGPSLD